jgi:hypothetical protein
MHVFINSLIIYWRKIRNLGLYLENIDRIQIFVDACDPLRAVTRTLPLGGVVRLDFLKFEVSRPSEMEFLDSFLPNICNEDKYCYLQFNVSI